MKRKKRSAASKPSRRPPDLAKRLLRWHRVHGRHDLPWQKPASPYRVWISEIMLQQTQVTTVIPYFRRFMRQFPNVTKLAHASLDDVLAAWSGLGYYARARNLHRAAREVLDRHAGKLPMEFDALAALPGIGRSTAGAILSLAANLPCPILDGNVKRVLCRYHGVQGWPGESTVQARLWDLAARHVPARHAAAYAQAIMDLGATLCTRARPRCDDCPLRADCVARRGGRQLELPQRRQRKPLPLRQTTVVLIENRAGQLLLERRPPAGIWGGLWSLPECAAGEDVINWLHRRFGWRVGRVDAGPPLLHTFTHFRLELTPVRVRLRHKATKVAESAELCWADPFDGMQRGLATPVRAMIRSTFNVEERKRA